MRILLVENEEKIANLIKIALLEQHYSVTVVNDGLAAQNIVESSDFDLAILDVMLSGVDGFEVCRYIRSLDLRFPILILTARDTVGDKVAGLDSGADDYLTKPFSLDELLARIRALSRRHDLVHQNKISFKDIELDSNTREVMMGGKRLPLTRKEFLFLEYLLLHQDRICSRTAISEHLWGNDYLFTPQQNDALNVLVSRVRRKISRRNRGKCHIKTVNRQGYRLA